MPGQQSLSERANSVFRRPVRSLPPEVARKIAAGEVIDRPNAILRELLDNAVDSGADWIQVEIEGGGIEKIRVVDNGIGMTKEDLENCARPHATSKITAETDLMNLSTLGFRGEALSSIAAVTRLQITSATQDEKGNSSAWRLTASVTQDHHIVPANLNQGTIVQSEALFENFPARRTFLKRPAAETTMCRQTFVEKALPRTDISFRLLIDGKQRLDLPRGQSLAQRFTEALGLRESPDLFYEIHSNAATDFKFTIIIGEPSVARNDKKLIYIYVNGRKINEYSLMQAIDYGATGYFPNGSHPVAAIFLEVNPALVDFNIHPAKREARFKDLSPIHKSISQAVRGFFRNYSVSKLSTRAVDSIFEDDIFSQSPWSQQPFSNHSSFGSKSSLQGNSEKNSSGKGQQNIRTRFFNDCYAQDFSPSESHVSNPEPNYTTEREPPKHGALQRDFSQKYQESKIHQEKPNFLETTNSQNHTEYKETEETTGQEIYTKPQVLFHSQEKASAAIQNIEKKFRYLGTTQGVYLVVELGDSLYLIDQHAAHERLLYNKFIAAAGQRQNLLIPYVVETSSQSEDEYLRGLQERLERAGFELKECGEGRWEFYSIPIQWKGTAVDLEQDLLNKRIAPEELVASLAATNACRQAVMDGTILDPDTARQLALDTLALEDPHCPHGRPLWIQISREDMDRGVKRL